MALPEVGDLVRVTHNGYGSINRGFPVGTVVRVTQVWEDTSDSTLLSCEYIDGSGWWYVGRDEFEPCEEKEDSMEEDSVEADEIVPPTEVENRMAAFDWANRQIPEGDLDVQVKLANWLLTGTYQ